MPPEHLRFGGGAADSTILPLMAIFLLIACALLFFLPRHKAIVPFLLACFVIPRYQIVVLGGLHFSPIRILILVALVRMFASPGQNRLPGGLTAVDKAVILWSVTALTAFLIEFPTMTAVIQGAGDFIDRIGGFFVVRFLIFDGRTLRRAIKALAMVCVIQGGPMIVEHIAHINIFGYFTGVNIVSTVRDGKIRAQGTLGYLQAGPFGGILIPVFVWLWTERKSRAVAIAGILGAMAMVFASNSSTSLMALLGTILGYAFWLRRKKMRQVRWAAVCVLIGLQLAMKAPVWALIAKIDFTGSSSSWQRYFLVDMTIRHFSDWWLIGTNNYQQWGWDAWDTCNQFVDVALKGGLAALLFFILILSRSFGAIGRARKLVEGNCTKEWLLWCFGTSLFASLTAQWGINYDGVLLMGLFVQLAFVTVATSETTGLVGRTAVNHAYERLALASREECKLLARARG